MLLYQLTTPEPNVLFRLVCDTDAVLLRQDAVYLLCQQRSWPTTKLYVLEKDMTARNVALAGGFVPLTDEQWVALTLTADKVILC